MMPIQTYKIVIVGDAGVGKTTFINHHLNGGFSARYISTLGVDIRPVHFNTNYGEIIFDVWDTAGQEKFSGLGDRYYTDARGAIAMFDTTAKSTLRNVEKWTNDVKRITGEIPIMIYGTKCDILNRLSQVIQLPNRVCGKNYNLISAKTKINLNMPFLNLARQLTGKEDLVFLN